MDRAITRPMPPALQLEPVTARTRVLMATLVVAAPLLITASAMALLDRSQQKLIGDSATITFVCLVALLGAIALVIDWGMRRHRISLDADGLEVVTSFYRRRLALAELQIDQARVIDLDERTQFKPMVKTNGTSLPGFQSGWFRLRNMRKALVATVSGKRVLYLPTTLGFDLLLQPRRPQALLEWLQELAAARSRG
ncbi:MAG: PH domain-containing protein [Lysobacter sp.]